MALKSGCKHIYTAGGGDQCRAPVFAKDFCSRHYAQEARGRRGKTKEIASPGEGTRVDVCVTLSPESLKKLDRRAERLKLTRSEVVDRFATSLD